MTLLMAAPNSAQLAQKLLASHEPWHDPEAFKRDGGTLDAEPQKNDMGINTL